MTDGAIARSRPAGVAREPGRWRLLGVLTLIQTGMTFVQFTPVSLLPVIKGELDLSVTRTVVLASAINAGALLASVPAGQVTNRLGERRTLALGAGVAGLSMLCAAVVSNPWLMLLPLLVAGAGVVTSHPAGIRLIMRNFDVRERGGAISIRQTAVPLGGALAALALPPLATQAGWRAGLVAAGVIALALAALAWSTVPPEQSAGEGTAPRAPSFTRVWRTRGVLRGVAICFLLNVGQVAVVTFIALFAHDSLGHSVGVGAVLLALVQGSGIVGRILWGVISDRAYGGRRRPLLILLGGSSAACLGALVGVTAGTPVPLLAVLTVAAGLTAVSWNGLGIALTTEAAGTAGAATAMSMIVLVVSFVNAAVPLAGGVIVDTTGSYRALWLAAAATLGAGTLLVTAAHEVGDAR